MDDDDMTAPAAAASPAASLLNDDAVFDILSRMPVKPICRFCCVSKGWRDLISDPAFLAEHRSRHPGQFLVDTGSFLKGPVESRDLRLMDMDGSVVRVIKGAGGCGMVCTTSLDDLICVNGGPSGGAHVVDAATGEVLLTCPRMEVVEHDVNPFILTRCYTTFGFGRASPSGAYKMIRLVEGRECEILTLGDDTVAGWRKAQAPPINAPDACVPFCRGSPISVNGVMYFLASTETYPDDTLLCFDLESERWRKKPMEGPGKVVAGEPSWRRRTRILAARITELNGSLCMVQSKEAKPNRHGNFGAMDKNCTDIWILADPDDGVWVKAYSIPAAPYACRYMPLRVMRGSGGNGKLLLQCTSFHKKEGGGEFEVLHLQVYDPHTETCTDVTEAPRDLAGRIGLCSLQLEGFVRRRRCTAGTSS